MVILGKKYGRLANRLWIFSHFAANAVEHGHSLLYRNFDNYIKYFIATRNNDFEGYSIKAKISRHPLVDLPLYWLIQMWISAMNRIKPTARYFMRIEKVGDGFDLNDPVFLRRAKQQKIIIRDGGLYYRDNANLIKHKNLIKKFFTPLPIYQKKIEHNFAQNRKSNTVLVGVHLRKNDYRTFLNGRFFISDEKFKLHMSQLQEILSKQGKEVQFLLCSDEKIDQDYYQDFNIMIGTGNIIEDLYSFAQCNFLMGPPSSYTLWASFYGEVPLAFLLANQDHVDLQDFKVRQIINEFCELVPESL